MKGFLAKLINWSMSTGGQRVLTGLGVYLGSSTISIAILNTVIQQSINNFNGFSSDMAGLMGIAGVDESLSIIIGAVLTKALLNQSSVRLIKNGN